MNNLIQVVDENDNPIGQATKQEVWDRRLWHRGVRVMVVDADGRFLLQKRAPSKKPMPNRWEDSATGHVDAEEGYLDAAKRELKEELGIKNVELEEVGLIKTDGRIEGIPVKRFMKVYKVVINPKEHPLIVSTREVSEVRWFSLEEIKQLISQYPDSVTHGLRDVIRLYYS